MVNLNPLHLLDRLAGAWLDKRSDWRMKDMLKAHPEMGELQLRKAEFNNGTFDAVMSSPSIAILADEAAGMLNKANAENYVQFDMMPRVDRGLRPIRVTVQWANGLMPAVKAANLEKELTQVRMAGDLASLTAVRLLRACEHLVAGITNVNYLPEGARKAVAILRQAGEKELADALVTGGAASMALLNMYDDEDLDPDGEEEEVLDAEE